jgi:hypothetical protein
MSSEVDVPFDAPAIAARIRALAGGRGHGDPATLALRLFVSEHSLRSSIDELLPRPTLDVMSGIVREFGVDPTWLVTGRYDPATHHAALQDGDDELRRAIGRLITAGSATTEVTTRRVPASRVNPARPGA